MQRLISGAGWVILGKFRVNRRSKMLGKMQ